MDEAKGHVRGMWGVLLIVMFLLGGTLGYIARDVRADAEVKEAAASARKDLEQATSTAIQRVQQVGAALGHGVAATAESTKAALTEAPRSKDSTARKPPSVAKGK